MIRSIGGAGGIGAIGGGSVATEGGFAEALESAVRAVEGAQTTADASLRDLATGQSADLHGTMIALEEANISLRAMGSVRDKVVDGWQTIWNMQI